MKPRLSEWNLEYVSLLISKGHNEDTWFDFKASMSDSDRLRRVVAAFANNEGGFIVFGVADNKELSLENRLTGIDPKEDYPVKLGNLLEKKVLPRPDFTFLNPPIKLTSGFLIHVCEIFESFSKPISVAKDEESLSFPLRTMRGTSYMSYEEVKQSFIGYAFMRDKLFLLKSELERLIQELRYFGAGNEKGSIGHTLQTETLVSCYFSAHGLLQKETQITYKLNEFKTSISLLNADVQSNLSLMSAINFYGKPAIEQANTNLRIRAQDLAREIANFLPSYNTFLETINPKN
jgi:hypothetical protein